MIEIANSETLKKKCVTLGNFYDTDIDGDKLYSDVNGCVMLLKTRLHAMLA